jgi:hypothetical protein
LAGSHPSLAPHLSPREIKTGRASEEVTYGITSLNRQRVGLEQAKPRKLWLLCLVSVFLEKALR